MSALPLLIGTAPGLRWGLEASRVRAVLLAEDGEALAARDGGRLRGLPEAPPEAPRHVLLLEDGHGALVPLLVAGGLRLCAVEHDRRLPLPAEVVRSARAGALRGVVFDGEEPMLVFDAARLPLRAEGLAAATGAAQARGAEGPPQTGRAP